MYKLRPQGIKAMHDLLREREREARRARSR